MKVIYAKEKYFRRMLNHILLLGEAEVLFTENSTTITITVTDRDGGHVGYLITDTDSRCTQTYLKLSECAAQKYADLDD